MGRTAMVARAWNSDWEPAPIIPRHPASAGASRRVTMPEAAAVRRAVRRVISVSSRG